MNGYYYTRMKFCGQDGFEQIQIRNGRAVIRQWLPDSQEIRAMLKSWDAKEVTPESLGEMLT